MNRVVQLRSIFIDSQKDNNEVLIIMQIPYKYFDDLIEYLYSFKHFDVYTK